MSATFNKFCSKFSKSTKSSSETLPDDFIKLEDLSQPQCFCIPEVLVSRTLCFTIPPHVEPLGANNQNPVPTTPSDTDESSSNEQEAPNPVPAPGLTQNRSSRSENANGAPFKFEITILSDEQQPKKILSVSTPVLDTEPVTQPTTRPELHYDDPNIQQCLPEMLDFFVRQVLDENHVEANDIDAFEVTGCSEWFPIVHEVISEVLEISNKRTVRFSWDKLGDTEAGYREIILQNPRKPVTQSLILHRNANFSINFHRDPYSGDDRPDTVWFISGLDGKGPPATVRLEYTLSSSCHCYIKRPHTIIEARGSSENGSHAVKTWVNHKMLKYEFSQLVITEQDLLMSIKIPRLTDGMGQIPVPLPCPPTLRGFGYYCVAVLVPQFASTVCLFFSSIPNMYELHLLMTGIFAALYLVQLMQILWFRFRGYLVEYDRPSVSYVAGLVSIFILLPQLYFSATSYASDGSAIAMLCVSAIGVGIYLAFETAFLFLARNNPITDYGDYLMYGEVLATEKFFTAFFTNLSNPRLSRAEKACLQHSMVADVLILLKSSDTVDNEAFWKEIAILHRIRHTLADCYFTRLNDLENKCPLSSMTKAEMFQYLVTRKRSLRERLPFRVSYASKPHGRIVKLLLNIVMFPVNLFRLTVPDLEAETKRRFQLIQERDRSIRL